VTEHDEEQGEVAGESLVEPAAARAGVAAPGRLYVVATPIGNLEDITARARRVLAGVDWVACEDTRRSGCLLQHLGIKTRLISFWQGNEAQRGQELLQRLRAGECGALISDGGTPLISDPGHDLVRDARRAELEVVPIPGPSALVAALSASGLPAMPFAFLGFLPRSRGKARARLEPLAGLGMTLVLYESPERIAATVALLLELLGPRPAVLAREITKLHEQFLRGSLAELGPLLAAQPARGEVTLVVGPPEEAASAPPEPEALDELLRRLLRAGASPRDAAREAARELGLPRRAVYDRVHSLDESPEPTTPEPEAGSE